MKNTGKHKTPIPQNFTTYEEAAEFWDTHSVSDYQEFLEPVEVKVDIKSRRFQIEIDEESFNALRRRATKQHKPVKDLASEILKQGLQT
jgi:hypothetical protein